MSFSVRVGTRRELSRREFFPRCKFAPRELSFSVRVGALRVVSVRVAANRVKIDSDYDIKDSD